MSNIIKNLDFFPQKSLDGLITALRHLRMLTSTMFNNGSYFIEVWEADDGYVALLYEYDQNIETLLQHNAVSVGYPDSGSNDEFVMKLYRDLSGRENAVAYVFESYGNLQEYHIIPGGLCALFELELAARAEKEGELP